MLIEKFNHLLWSEGILNCLAHLTEVTLTTNQNSLFKSRDRLSANQGPFFEKWDLVGWLVNGCYFFTWFHFPTRTLDLNHKVIVAKALAGTLDWLESIPLSHPVFQELKKAANGSNAEVIREVAVPYKPGTMMIADESQDRRDYLYQFCHRFSDILQQSLKFAPLEKLEMVQGFAEQLKQVAKGLLHLCVTMVATPQKVSMVKTVNSPCPSI